VNQESVETCELKNNVVRGRKRNNAINKVTHYRLNGQGSHPGSVWDSILGYEFRFALWGSLNLLRSMYRKAFRGVEVAGT
jgi:hypothetical protein